MKKIISLVLVAMMAATLCVAAFAAESGTAYGNVPKTSDTITIDGKGDAVYKQGLVVKSLDKDEKGNAASASFTAYLLWNGKDTIYCFAEVKDSTWFEHKSDASAWNTDSLELFLDYSNKVARTRDQYRVDHNGVGTYYETKTLTNEECKPFGFEGYAAQKTKDGYTLEFAMKAYKEPIAGDMKVGFHLMLNDMTAEGTRNNIHSDACNNSPSKFGYITLSNTAVKAPVVTTAATKPATSTGSSAATFDAAIILAVVAAVAGTGVVVSKKH